MRIQNFTLLIENQGGEGEQKKYYLDATSGNDSNTGLSAASAWKTVAKVNASSFGHGDQVLFKRGETWTFTDSGDRLVGANGVTYADYGSGALPIIDGDGVSDCFLASGKSSVKLQNLDLRNGYDSCAQFISCTNVQVIDCNMQGAGNDNLIFINNNNNVLVSGGTYHEPSRRVAGTLVTNIEMTDGGSGFTISGVECYGAENAGITIHNHSSADPQGQTNIPTNVLIDNVTSHDNAGYGIQVLANDTSVTPVITIQDSNFNSNDSGVRIYKSAASSYYPEGVTISGCTMGVNTTYGFYFESDSVTMKRCVVYGTTQQNRIFNGKNINLYNNTIWLQPASALFPLYMLGSRCENIVIKNNIIHMDNTSGQVIGFAADTITGADVNYNLYFFPNAASARWLWNNTAYTYANWKTNSGMDANSPSSNIVDPSFVSEPTDLHLNVGSPAIDVGVVIPGVTDGYLGNAPDCGAYEKA